MSTVKVVPPSYRELMNGNDAQSSVQRPRRLTSLTALLAIICCISVFIVTIWMSHYSLKSWTNNQDRQQSLVTLKMNIRLDNDVDAVQRVISSLENNYVTYHVNAPTQQMWILDDFEQGVQVMKVETLYETTCYVTTLNRSQAIEPWAYLNRQHEDNINLSDEISAKKRQPATPVRMQSVLMSSDTPLSDRTMLGVYGNDLCPPEAPVYLVTPLSHADTMMEERSAVGMRSKRSVKKCVMACCYLVCCCNQKWLHWQSDHFFNCKHVCSGCTDASNTYIEKKC